MKPFYSKRRRAGQTVLNVGGLGPTVLGAEGKISIHLLFKLSRVDLHLSMLFSIFKLLINHGITFKILSGD